MIRGVCSARLGVMVCAAGLVLLAPRLARAQTPESAVPSSRRALLLRPRPIGAQENAGAVARSPLGAAGLSLVLPGAGQHVLGQRRKWVYAALEITGWVVFLDRRSAGAEARDRYKDYAWEEGRIQAEQRVDAPFAYYEAMSKWTSSGRFDTDPVSPGIQPEPDADTFNGAIWARAVQIYVAGAGGVSPTDPAYQSALAYYSDLAYHTEFLWDWSGVPGGMDEMADLIAATDDRFREATTALGAVIANHLISSADAYLSARGRSAPLSLSVVPDRRALGPGWLAVVSVPVGR